MRTPGRFVSRLVAVACVCSAFVPGAHASSVASESAVLELIQKYRKETWDWQQLMRAPRTPTARLAERTSSAGFRQWALDHWRREAARARNAALHPSRLAAWLCIHHHEGPWTANTGNGYYGGLQMNLAFQRRYGRELLAAKGTANRWTAIEQIWVAERAYRSGRGFYPWPNAARACRLL